MSKRTIENRLDDLEQETQSNSLTVAFKDPSTGELYTEYCGNERIDPDDVTGQLVVIERALVVPREQAEREGREILRPAENAADDAVVVPIFDD